MEKIEAGQRSLARWLLLPGLLLTILSLSVMVGWWTEQTSLVQVIATSAPMQFTTALGFFICGLGLMAVSLFPRSGWVPGISGALILLLGSISLIQSGLDVDFGIDTFFIEPFTSERTDSPGRMSNVTAICFFLSGIALFLTRGRSGRIVASATVGLIATLVIAIAVTALLGYFAELTSVGFWGSLTKMAIHTASGFLILGGTLVGHSLTCRDETAGLPTWPRIAVVLATLSISVCFWQAAEAAERVRILDAISRRAEEFSLEVKLRKQIGTLAAKDLADRWQWNQSRFTNPDEDWQSYLESSREVLVIDGIARVDSDRELRWLARRHDSIRELNSTSLADLGSKAFRRFVQQPDSSTPFVLYSRSPDQTRLAFPAPAVAEGETSLFLVVCRANEMFSPLTEAPRFDQFEIMIWAPEGALYSTTETERFTDPDSTEIATAALPQSTWKVSLLPDARYTAELETTIPDLALVIGLLLSVALSMAVFQADKASRQARQEHRSNQELADEVDKRLAAESELIDLNTNLERLVEERGDALASIHDQLALAVAGANIGVWHYDLTNDQIEFSERALQLFGLPGGYQMTYERFRERLHEDDEARVSEAVQLAIDNGTEYDVEYRVVWLSGHIHWIAAKGRAYYNEDGEPVRMEGIVIDIDPQKDREAEIEQMNEDMGTMLYVLSHDLKEPVRSITNFSEIVVEDYTADLDPTARDYLARVHAAGQRLNGLLNDVLTVSRTRTMPEPEREVPLRRIVDEALLSNEADIAEKGAHVDIADDLPDAFISKQWAIQAVHNLISNAVKFSSDHTDGSNPPEITIRGFRSPTEVGISVSDRGPGVPEELREKIFQLFQRGVKREVAGTGVGLAIVKRVAERHGGRAWCEEREGGGTCMYLTFARKSKKPNESDDSRLEHPDSTSEPTRDTGDTRPEAISPH